MTLALVPADPESPIELARRVIAGAYASERPWPTPAFRIARALKVHAALRDLGTDEMLVSICADALVRSGELLGDDLDELAVAWTAVRFAEGDGPLDKALAEAEETGLRLPNRSAGFALFISTCAALQRQVGDEDIFASIATIAGTFGVSKPTASAWRRLAVQDGFLTATKPATARRAARFRFRPRALDDGDDVPF